MSELCPVQRGERACLEDLLSSIPERVSQLKSPVQDAELLFLAGAIAMSASNRHQPESHGRNAWAIFSQLVQWDRLRGHCYFQGSKLGADERVKRREEKIANA